MLGAKAVGREDPIGILVGFGPQAVHELDEVAVPGAALAAVEQVLGGGRIGRFTRLLGQITVEDSLFPQMMSATGQGLPPSRPRSFRAARNRCTRTVDSFSPVIAATSRGVQSP